MRAGRLITLLLILERRGRVTADHLADELEVSTRTVFRDIETLCAAGVRIVGTRGAAGGFELRDVGVVELVGAGAALGADARGNQRRAAVLVTAEGRRMAALLGQPVLGFRRSGAPPATHHDDGGWSEASFRFDTIEGALSAVLALGPHICVVGPDGLRQQVVDRLAQMAALYAPRTRETARSGR